MAFFKTHIHRDINKHPKAQLMLLGGLLFSLGLVTSITTTYAWFQINPLLTVQDLNLRINPNADDYWLTVDLINSKGRINHDDIEHYPDHFDEEGNFTGFTLADMDYDPEVGLNDVSGMFADEWLNDSTKTRPEFRSNYGAYPGNKDHYTKSVVATKGYLQTVFVFTAGEDCEVYLTKDSGIKSMDTAESAQSKKKNLEDLLQVANTVRFSFYSDDGYYIAKQPEDETHEDITYETYYGGVLDMNGDGYYDSVDGEEVLYGEYEGEATYNDNVSDSLPYENGSTFTANHQPGVKQVNVDYQKIVKEPAASIKTYIYDEDKPMRPLQSICKLKKGEEKQVVFSVYCEGWDKYMTDALASASFNITLGFTALIKG